MPPKFVMNQRHSFTFDHVYQPHEDQAVLYGEESLATRALLQGYNATILAYGQTGTGKTYTMEGFTNDAKSPERGLIVRLRLLFTIYKQNTP